MISAISSVGHHFYCLVKGRNNQAIFTTFLAKLIRRLDTIDPNWKSYCIIVMDNSSIHQGKEAKDFYKRTQIPILFTGVASFSAIPIEKYFATLKARLGKETSAWYRESCRARGDQILKLYHKDTVEGKIDRVCQLID